MTSDQLRVWRERHGLRQRDMADALGVDERTYRRWESDEVPVPRYIPVALVGIAETLTEEDD